MKILRLSGLGHKVLQLGASLLKIILSEKYYEAVKKIFLKLPIKPPQINFSRQNFLNLIDQNRKILEIGPFDKPCITGKNVKYADILSTKEIKDRIGGFNLNEKINHKTDSVPLIDYVLKDRTLKAVTDRFDIVFSSHCIEHQPDFINHLKDVEKILKVGGYYFIIIPDKRFCFDYFLSESSLASIIEANFMEHRKHTLKSVIEHRCLTTSNDTLKYWKNEKEFKKNLSNRLNIKTLSDAIKEFKINPNVDVHAWQFTPNSFVEIINKLVKLEYIKFKIEKVYETQFGNNEFYIILKKC